MKSGLRILIRAPKAPFSVPPKQPKTPKMTVRLTKKLNRWPRKRQTHWRQWLRLSVGGPLHFITNENILGSFNCDQNRTKLLSLPSAACFLRTTLFRYFVNLMILRSVVAPANVIYQCCRSNSIYLCRLETVRTLMDLTQI